MHCSKQSIAQLPAAEKKQASLSCFTPSKAEHGYLLPGRIQLSCLLGEKCLLWQRSKISKAFHSACLSYKFCGFSCFISRCGQFLWPTFFSKAGNKPPVLYTPLCLRPWYSLFILVCGRQAVFRCFRRHTIRIIHLVSRVMLCHWQNPYINTQLVIWLCPEEKKIDSLGDFTVL